MNMLVAEDNRGDVQLIRKAVQTSPVLVVMDHVTDGEQLLAYLLHHGPYVDAPTPDLIVLDLSMPRKNGWMVIHELSVMPQLRAIPLVVFTGVLTPTIGQQLAALGVARVVRKPVDLDAYIHAVHEILRWWQQHYGPSVP